MWANTPILFRAILSPLKSIKMALISNKKTQKCAYPTVNGEQEIYDKYGIRRVHASWAEEHGIDASQVSWKTLFSESNKWGVALAGLSISMPISNWRIRIRYSACIKRCRYYFGRFCCNYSIHSKPVQLSVFLSLLLCWQQWGRQ